MRWSVSVGMRPGESMSVATAVFVVGLRGRSRLRWSRSEEAWETEVVRIQGASNATVYHLVTVHRPISSVRLQLLMPIVLKRALGTAQA